jgi:hypothetical protein
LGDQAELTGVTPLCQAMLAEAAHRLYRLSEKLFISKILPWVIDDKSFALLKNARIEDCASAHGFDMLSDT